MGWDTWLAFVVVETVLCITPGPAVLLVLSQAVLHGTTKTLWTILGIVAANTVYFLLSATGIGAILLTSYELFFAIKWIGAAYLIALGLRAIFEKRKRNEKPGMQGGYYSAAMFSKGFILQMSNPKALVFFAALLPQFVDPSSPILPQVAILAMTSIAIEFLVQVAYAGFATRCATAVAGSWFSVITSRVAGGVLIAAGVGMAALRRQ